MINNANLDKIDIFDEVLYDRYCEEPAQLLNHIFVTPEAAFQWMAETLEEQSGIKTEIRKNGKPIKVDRAIRPIVIQSVQELLMHAAAHEGVKNAAITIEQNGKGVKISVEDDGNGFKAKDAGQLVERAGGLSFLKIRERLNNIGGKLAIEANPKVGTRVTMLVPEHVTNH